MPTETDRVTVEELFSRVREEMLPIRGDFSYFTLAPLGEEEFKQFLEEPIAALPPAICAALPKTSFLLAPYLEKANGNGKGNLLSFEKPADQKRIFSSRVLGPEGAILAFSVQDQELADYHYSFYGELAGLIAAQESNEAHDRYRRQLREELAAEVHGEVEDRSWHLKQALLRRQKHVRKETRAFLDYARQSFEDTLALYLHGICCDIDVATGPRQMPSRYLRRRLELLMSLYPPPEGYAVLPDQPKKR